MVKIVMFYFIKKVRGTNFRIQSYRNAKCNATPSMQTTTTATVSIIPMQSSPSMHDTAVRIENSTSTPLYPLAQNFHHLAPPPSPALPLPLRALLRSLVRQK